MFRAADSPVHAAGEDRREQPGAAALDLSPVSARDVVRGVTGIESGFLLRPGIVTRVMHRMVRSIARLTTTVGWKREESPHGTR